ncbi:MAG: diacylglycerol kinase [bacterium]|nr:diacylglycerol kinase [bacterium]
MEPGKIPPPRKGLARLWAAFFHSLAGLKSVYQSEEAFRLEVWLLPPLTLVAWVLPLGPFWQVWLTFGALFLLLMELINTALERLVDLITSEWNPLAKDAKDIGSALVLFSTGFYLLLWALAGWSLCRADALA